MEDDESLMSWLARKIEEDYWPILFRGDWLEKENVLDMMEEIEARLVSSGTSSDE